LEENDQVVIAPDFREELLSALSLDDQGHYEAEISLKGQALEMF